MSENRNTPRPLFVTVACALLVALSIVCGKFLQLPVGEVLRFSFENLPILLAGMAFGPVAGALVGAAADLLGCLAVGYAINPIITLGAVTIGAVGGLVYRLAAKSAFSVRVILAVVTAHVIGSVMVKTIGLSAFYSMPLFVLMLWRLLNYVLVGAAEAALLCALLKNKALGALLSVGQCAKRPMTYDEAVAYMRAANRAFCKPGFDRVAALCEALGDPQDSLRYIHVTGTNGKGSFCAMTASILRCAGYKVGVFSTPAVKETRESLSVNGEAIDRESFAALIDALRPYADAMEDKPTEFELLTAAAFLHFRRQRCDIVVLEVGMGGRLDATNIIRQPLLSVITGVALDHMAYLGDSVESIAAEKAGIIKDACPVLYGGDDTAASVISAAAQAVGSPLYTVEYASLCVKSATLEGTVFDYDRYQDLRLSLLGSYQPRNAAVVLRAMDILRAEGLDISDAAIREGLSSASLHARFELLSAAPLVIFDGAHNAEGIAAAVESIRLYFGEQKVYLLTGVLCDKDYRAIAHSLSTVAARAFVITPDNPRALDAETYAALLDERGVPSRAYADIPSAYRAAAAQAKADDVPLICLGSLYVYASL